MIHEAWHLREDGEGNDRPRFEKLDILSNVRWINVLGDFPGYSLRCRRGHAALTLTRDSEALTPINRDCHVCLMNFGRPNFKGGSCVQLPVGCAD